MPPVATGTCCDVTIGTDCETLMTAFLFSVVMTEGLDSTLTKFWVASALRAARNRSVAKAKRLSPAGTGPPSGMRFWAGMPGNSPDGEEVAENFPLRTAQCVPGLVSS